MSEEWEDRKREIHGEVVSDESRVDDVQPTYFVAQDSDLLKTVKADADLKDLAALYSPLVRLTKITTQEKETFQIDVDLITGSMILGMDVRDFEEGRWAKLEANAMFLKTVINDSHKGFKMTLLSRLRKEIIVSPEKKKSRWPGRG